MVTLDSRNMYLIRNTPQGFVLFFFHKNLKQGEKIFKK